MQGTLGYGQALRCECHDCTQARYRMSGYQYQGNWQVWPGYVTRQNGAGVDGVNLSQQRGDWEAATRQFAYNQSQAVGLGAALHGLTATQVNAALQNQMGATTEFMRGIAGQQMQGGIQLGDFGVGQNGCCDGRRNIPPTEAKDTEEGK